MLDALNLVISVVSQQRRFWTLHVKETFVTNTEFFKLKCGTAPSIVETKSLL